MSIRNIAACIAIGGFSICAWAASSAGAGAEARLVVTVADHMKHKPQILKPGDIENTESMRIVNIAPLYGDKELYILIDDAANYDFGAKLEELRDFVNSQPPSTAVGVAFIRDGELKIAQAPAKDHKLIARELRAPAGSKPENPWCALSGLIRGWAAGTERREVLMITSGLDKTAGGKASCGNADTAIAQAQRAGVSVFAIYHPVADYATQEWRRVDDGVVELSHVCYETGGEAYFVTHSAMETIVPFLEDIAEHLNNQYRMTVVFDSTPEPGLRDVYLRAFSPDLELMAPTKVWVGSPER